MTKRKKSEMRGVRVYDYLKHREAVYYTPHDVLPPMASFPAWMQAREWPSTLVLNEVQKYKACRAEFAAHLRGELPLVQSTDHVATVGRIIALLVLREHDVLDLGPGHSTDKCLHASEDDMWNFDDLVWISHVPIDKGIRGPDTKSDILVIPDNPIRDGVLLSVGVLAGPDETLELYEWWKRRMWEIGYGAEQLAQSGLACEFHALGEDL